MCESRSTSGIPASSRMPRGRRHESLRRLLELQPKAGQGGPQLVRRVGDEVPLHLEQP